MANGDARFFTEQFSDSITGLPYSGVKVYHYAAGTTTLKNVWQDAGKTTALANPVTGDSAGRVSFYADGDYRLRVETSAGVLLYDWDNVRITSDNATMWEGDQGTAYPGATSKNQGQLFAKLNGSSLIDELAINDDGTGFHRVPAALGLSTKAALPSPSASPSTLGRVRYVTDSVRGLWLDTSTAWISITGETVNVREFGAKGDGSTNDTAAFQAAADAVSAGGTLGGQLLIPPGNYVVDQFTVGSDVWVTGTGANSCRLISSAANGTNGILRNKNGVGGDARIRVTDITFARTVDVPANLYNEMIYMKNCQRVWIERCQFGGPSTTLSSFNAGIHLERCQKVWITDCYFSGIAGESIYLNRGTGGVFTGRTHITNCIFELTADYAHRAVLTNVAQTFVHGCSIESPGGSGSNGILVELEQGVTDVIVEANIATNACLVKTGFASRVNVVGNTVSNTGTAAAPCVNITTAQGAVSDVLVATNNITGGYILAQQTSGALSRVTIDGNLVLNQPSSAQFGIRAIGASELAITSNIVRASQGGGIGVTSGSAKVTENFVDNCGLGGNTIPLGLDDGFYWEGLAADTGRGILARNVSRNNGGHGYVIKQPQNLFLIDNECLQNNTGTWLFNSMTTLGATPLLRVSLYDDSAAGSPEGLYYAAPGSVFYGLNGKLYVKNAGYTSVGWKEVSLL